jgi:hypothetical protein
MTPTEAAVIEAACTLARAVREYNALIDADEWLPTSPEYIAVASAMETAEDALVAVAQPLIE